MFTIVPKVRNEQRKCLLWLANTHKGSFTVPRQAAVCTGFNAVPATSSLFLNTNDKHLLLKIVQIGAKKSAVNISKLQGGKRQPNITTSPCCFGEISSTFLSTSDRARCFSLSHTTVARGMDLVFYISSFTKVSAPVLGIVH